MSPSYVFGLIYVYDLLTKLIVHSSKSMNDTH